MTCPNCGFEDASNPLFCPRCGHAQSSQAIPGSFSPVPGFDAPLQPPAPPDPFSPQQPPIPPQHHPQGHMQQHPPSGQFAPHHAPSGPVAPANPLALTGFITGILALLLNLTCCGVFFGTPLAIVGLICSWIGKEKTKKEGAQYGTLALVGLVCSILALVVLAVFIITGALSDSSSVTVE